MSSTMPALEKVFCAALIAHMLEPELKVARKHVGIRARLLLAVVRRTCGQGDVYRAGYDKGFADGYAEGRRVARPVALPDHFASMRIGP